MTDERTPIEIDNARLILFFRIWWPMPVVLFFAVGSIVFWPVIIPFGLVCVGAYLVAAALAFVIAPLRVRALEYWIEGTILRINQGLIVRKCKSIPLDRVTDVQLVQYPAMRICGVWYLQSQTAGSGQKAPEGTIIGACNPEAVRDTIMQIRDRAAFKSDAALQQ